MLIHLVGGFLGSGKTTAICAAARQLVNAGKKVAIITNDQGRYLVDTGFVQSLDLPAVEVAGGCFCCRFDDLEARLDELIERVQPEVVFAESVGSCADLLATVIRPLRQVSSGGKDPASLSVFVDSRLLRHHLLGHGLPFSPDVIYLFEKQIEEAGLLVLNKVDLLTPAQLTELNDLTSSRFPGKPFLCQNSLATDGAHAWLDWLNVHKLTPDGAMLNLDYERYASAEAGLAWLDETWRLPHAGRAEWMAVLGGIQQELQSRNVAIGHLKFLVCSGGQTIKISRTTIPQPGWLDVLADIPSGPGELLINARVEMPADQLHMLVQGVLNAYSIGAECEGSDAFHPGLPQPRYRLA
jgi:Ni2+-binding GTPase involved in maturation of urease and hydrogenase